MTFICVAKWLRSASFAPFNKESRNLVAPQTNKAVEYNLEEEEKRKKNRNSEKLGYTQIVVIQFTAGRAQLFQQAAAITFTQRKQAFTRLQTLVWQQQLTSNPAFLCASPFVREEIILFYFFC